MSFDKNDLDKILSLSPDEFEKKLNNALAASGIDPRISGMFLKDKEKIRNAISGLSEKELSNLSAIIQKNNLGHLEDIIKKEINGRR